MSTEEINKLVTAAREHWDNNELIKAKNLYLDAAQIALSIAKAATSKVDKLSFENLASVLVDEAKACHEAIKIAALPAVPTEKPFETKSNVPSKNQGLIIRKRPDIYSLFVIKEGGVPLIAHNFEDMDGATEHKINEVLFSGAITAINSLMLEAIERPIQAINFDKGVLIIHTHERVNYVLFAEQTSPGLQKALSKFCDELERATKIPLSSFKMMRDISKDESTKKLIDEIF
ncbi:MAG: hypothetical protein INQ03_11025 [Candidatus Heimdallarchaeota archaeon]|nr:hypothetical protein [Candidatus Heimdallarchaeota archaeon]